MLILDEPTNGLDPDGMAEMRTLIRSLRSGARRFFFPVIYSERWRTSVIALASFLRGGSSAKEPYQSCAAARHLSSRPVRSMPPERSLS